MRDEERESERNKGRWSVHRTERGEEEIEAGRGKKKSGGK